MEAIILAGGLGTRLKPLIINIPKPMAPISGEPSLKYLLHQIKLQGINHVTLATGYGHNIIYDYFGLEYDNMEISYSQEMFPLGTGGAIAKALSLSNEKNVFVLNGDTFFNCDFEKLYDFHISGGYDLSIALKHMDKADRYGTVEIEGNRIIQFKEKRSNSTGLINCGVYIIDKNLLKDFGQDIKFSFEKDFLEPQVEKMRFGGLTFDQYFIDIGIPEDYKQAQVDIPFRLELHLNGEK